METYPYRNFSFTPPVHRKLLPFGRRELFFAGSTVPVEFEIVADDIKVGLFFNFPFVVMERAVRQIDDLMAL